MSTVINSWEDMLQKELNFQQEGRNIREVRFNVLLTRCCIIDFLSSFRFIRI